MGSLACWIHGRVKKIPLRIILIELPLHGQNEQGKTISADIVIKPLILLLHLLYDPKIIRINRREAVFSPHRVRLRDTSTIPGHFLQTAVGNFNVAKNKKLIRANEAGIIFKLTGKVPCGLAGRGSVSFHGQTAFMENPRPQQH